MKLADLVKRVTEYEAQIAPTSETALWGRFLDRMREITGIIPYNTDYCTNEEVPDDEAQWWLTAYESLLTLETMPHRIRNRIYDEFWEALDAGEARPDVLDKEEL